MEAPRWTGRCPPQAPQGPCGPNRHIAFTSPPYRPALRCKSDTEVPREDDTGESPRAVTLVLVALVLVTALALGAGAALASEGDMSGMPGMTDEEMQQMEPPQPAAEADGHGSETAAGADGHEADPAAGSHMDMISAPINWLVVGGFLVLIAGTTLAAAATKRHLARRMAAGELAGAGALDV